jgi:hypothetical protein
MSAFIERQIAWFKDRGLEYGHRRRKILEEISRQEGIVASYSHITNPNIQDREHAESYLTALKQTELELDQEAAQRGLELSEGEKIYWDMYCAVLEERGGREPETMDLARAYLEFKNKYFGDSVPEPSESFAVEFVKLPFDVAGASHLPEDSAKFGLRRGVRINEKLRGFPAEAKVALLHEMIHAAGIRKHGDEFKQAVSDLFAKGAYTDSLIL